MLRGLMRGWPAAVKWSLHLDHRGRAQGIGHDPGLAAELRRAQQVARTQAGGEGKVTAEKQEAEAEQGEMPALARHYGAHVATCGKAQTGSKHAERAVASIADFATYMRHQQDDAPLYVFFDGMPAEMAADFSPPRFFRDDTYAVLPPGKRPPHRWFLLGQCGPSSRVSVVPFPDAAARPGARARRCRGGAPWRTRFLPLGVARP